MLLRTALHFSASWGCYRTMEKLLEFSDIDVNGRDFEGKTPLYKVIMYYATSAFVF